MFFSRINNFYYCFFEAIFTKMSYRTDEIINNNRNHSKLWIFFASHHNFLIHRDNAGTPPRNIFPRTEASRLCEIVCLSPDICNRVRASESLHNAPCILISRRQSSHYKSSKALYSLPSTPRIKHNRREKSHFSMESTKKLLLRPEVREAAQRPDIDVQK